MLRVINHSTYDVTLDGAALRLSAAGGSVTLRIPAFRLSRITRRWRHLPFPARQERSDNEKTPLIADGPPRAKVYHRHTKTQTTILIIPAPPTESHLSTLPDETPLGDLLLPGTHQSAALRGWPFSQCQSPKSSLAVQLADGIRFFDIRLAVKDGILQAFHGYLPQHATLPSILSTISAFLSSQPRETLVLCIQQEHPSVSPLFSELVRRDMEEYIQRGEWFLENRVPLLGEVRGQGVLMSRFGGSIRDGGEEPWIEKTEPVHNRRQPSDEAHYYEGESFASSSPTRATGIPPTPSTTPPARMGWKPEIWPNSLLDGFTWHAAGTPCRTQDWYEIYGFFNIPAKFNVLTDHLLASAALPPGENLTISFASASSIPLALPPVIANGFGFPRWGMGLKGVNERLKEFLLDRLADLEGEKGKEEGGKEEAGLLRGIIPMDYYKDSGVVELMMALNVVQAQR